MFNTHKEAQTLFTTNTYSHHFCTNVDCAQAFQTKIVKIVL